MEKKNIPLILMLSAGAITWIITFFQKYDPLISYLILFGVMVFFYVIGTLITWMFISFDKKNEELAIQNQEEQILSEEEKEE